MERRRLSDGTEVVFGRAMAATGRPRESYVLSNKLWFDTYPQQTFAEQVDASVRRLGLDHIDVIFCQVPLPGIEIVDLAREMGGIVASGRAKVWGTVNWTPKQMREAHAVAAEEGFAPPTLTEIKYSVVRRRPAEAADYTSVFSELGVGIHASNVFEGGLLTGKYATMEELAARRILPEDVHGAREAYFARRADFLAAAEELGVKPAQLALAFAIANDTVVSALIGATRPEQVDDAAGAAGLAADRGAELRERLHDFAELKAAAGS